MRYFWGFILGGVIFSVAWMYVADRTVSWARADERSRLAPVVERLETDLKRISRNLCGDESLQIEELSYRCAK